MKVSLFELLFTGALLGEATADYTEQRVYLKGSEYQKNIFVGYMPIDMIGEIIFGSLNPYKE